MSKEPGYALKLGIFVIIGLALLTAGIYFIGKQKNLFSDTFILRVQFTTVSGLKTGNNVLFSGINAGMVDNIELITDTTVMVYLVIKKDMQRFIKTDALAAIGSDGLMGDKVLTIYPGSPAGLPVSNNALIISKKRVEMDDLLSSVKTSVDNAGIITTQLAQFTYKMNNSNGALSRLLTDEEFSGSLKATLGNLQTSSNEFAKFTTKMNSNKGAFGRLMNDEKFSNSLDSTMQNLKTGTKGLSDNMEAAKSNFLLKPFFKRKAKADAKKAAALKKAELIKIKKAAAVPVNAGDSIRN
jgi:phospholipid/cholesterol/gamma-HCH transport system substrate-binding protein